MKKVISLLILLFEYLLFIGLTSIASADGHYSQYSEENICSWFDLEIPPIEYVNEANKRNIDCRRRIDSGSGRVQYFCQYGYKRVGKSCIKKITQIIPSNAYKYGNTWYCNSGYKKTGNSCSKIISNSIKIPLNAYKSGNTWYCNSGYKKTGNSCSKIISNSIKIPLNAYKSGNTWYCNSGYKKTGNSCSKIISNSIKIPANIDEDNLTLGEQISGVISLCLIFFGFFFFKTKKAKVLMTLLTLIIYYSIVDILKNSKFISFVTNFDFLSLIIVCIFFFWFIANVSLGGRIKKCAWCKSKKMKFISGRKGSWEWKYSNQDGSRDKRRNGNIEQAPYISEFKCKKCTATTDFFHKPSGSASKRKKILKRQLVFPGNGKRKGFDYESAKFKS
jgi:hypothetical protein